MTKQWSIPHGMRFYVIEHYDVVQALRPGGQHPRFEDYATIRTEAEARAAVSLCKNNPGGYRVVRGGNRSVVCY